MISILEKNRTKKSNSHTVVMFVLEKDLRQIWTMFQGHESVPRCKPIRVQYISLSLLVHSEPSIINYMTVLVEKLPEPYPIVFNFS